MQLMFLLFPLAVCVSSTESEPHPERLSEIHPLFIASCADDNDLYRVMRNSGIDVLRVDEPCAALRAATEGAGILVLADGYPEEPTPLGDAFFKVAAEKRVRVYLEYPSYLPDSDLSEPRHTHWERAVVTSDAFGPALERLSILGINDCHFLPCQVAESYIVVAKVAGLDRAIFGLPEASWPILFEPPQSGIMVATTKLSQFVTARYSPTQAWNNIWLMILGWLQPTKELPQLIWNPVVRPSYTRHQVLDENVERQAFERGIAWFQNSRLSVHESWTEEVERRLRGYPDGVAPAPDASWPIGDGSEGFLEGYSSTIRFDGTQPVRYYLRNDCMGEISMALALGSRLLDNSSYGMIATNLNDFIRLNSTICRGPRSDPKSPSYGLHGWDTRPEEGGSGNYYGDDNARSILGTIAASALLGSDRWDDAIIRNLVANLRTTGTHGFRQASLRDSMLQENGWQHFFNQPTIHYAPHYQAYLWAAFLWAYQHTGYETFLTRARQAISMTMEAYPENWRWTNGIQQERARLLLPLAWLVRVDDTTEHREWLQLIGHEMLRSQDTCGAIREELGRTGAGNYPPPRSNEAYGTTEASLISQNGDPISDLLYTTNFAFIGLHEAAAATGEEMFSTAEDRLAEFLCRIQVQSEKHPELNGAWFRAFDFSCWDYWGSNADAGWGAWSIESGWTQGWITAVLAMRLMRTSLWDLTEGCTAGKLFEKCRANMLPDESP